MHAGFTTITIDIEFLLFNMIHALIIIKQQPHHVIIIRRRTSIKISPRTTPTAIPMIWLVVRMVVDSVGSCTLATSKPRAAYSSR